MSLKGINKYIWEDINKRITCLKEFHCCENYRSVLGMKFPVWIKCIFCLILFRDSPPFSSKVKTSIGKKTKQNRKSFPILLEYESIIATFVQHKHGC